MISRGGDGRFSVYGLVGMILAHHRLWYIVIEELKADKKFPYSGISVEIM